MPGIERSSAPPQFPRDQTSPPASRASTKRAAHFQQRRSTAIAPYRAMILVPLEGFESESNSAADEHASRSLRAHFWDAGILFLENPAPRHLPPPNSLRLGDACAQGDREYHDVFGPAGSIQRSKAQFISIGFNPRKALRLNRSLRPRVNAELPDQSTNICAIPVFRTFHAA